MRKKRFYLIGIGGVAMASLAGLLKAKGYEVAGSDQEMYEPMRGMLKKLKIPVFTPYNMFHVKRFKPDVVIVGNAIGRRNPELEYVMSNGQSYRSMSDILLDEFIDGRKAIVITGTHGKTTTTALIAWILECAGLDPTVFVGGAIRNFPPKASAFRRASQTAKLLAGDSTFKLGNGKYIVIEGDEYDTAFFDKSPKFWHYRPFIGVVTNIELDHVDIYPNLEAYKYAFERFMNLIPSNGLLVANRHDKNTIELVKKFHACPPKLRSCWRVKLFGSKRNDFMTQNIAAATAVARFIGVSHETIKKAVASFKGVKRRSEVIGVKHGITVIDDYAHHPTAVRETLNALRSKFSAQGGPAFGGHRRLFLMFEPGSASSKRRIFEKQYIEAFQRADVVYVYKPYKASNLKPDEMFHMKHVASVLRKKGIPAKSFNNIDDLLFHVKRDARPKDVIVIMSCRGFDGLRERILEEL